MSEADWAQLKAQWAEQQRSPFVLYKLARARTPLQPPRRAALTRAAHARR